MGNTEWDIDNFRPHVFFTPQGKEKVRNYITYLKKMREEILDARKDTAEYIDLPDEEDILADLEEHVDSSKEYKTTWYATDNHYYPISLYPGDYRIKFGK